MALLVVGLTGRALATPERRTRLHRRSADALARSEDRLDELFEEMQRVDAAQTNTKRAIRQQALAREARRAKRTHRFLEWRFDMTARLVARDEEPDDGVGQSA